MCLAISILALEEPRNTLDLDIYLKRVPLVAKTFKNITAIHLNGAIDLRLGDRVNGYEAEENVQSIADVIPWFQEAIAHFYPNS